MQSKPVYKTAKDLGISEDERSALISLIGPLSRDELAFDMETFHGQSCGTAVCIGGWVAARLNTTGLAYSSGRRFGDCALGALYYPDVTDAWGATGPQGARAIVNFLMTGKPDWAAVMTS